MHQDPFNFFHHPEEDGEMLDSEVLQQLQDIIESNQEIVSKHKLSEKKRYQEYIDQEVELKGKHVSFSSRKILEENELDIASDWLEEFERSGRDISSMPDAEGLRSYLRTITQEQKEEEKDRNLITLDTNDTEYPYEELSEYKALLDNQEHTGHKKHVG